MPASREAIWFCNSEFAIEVVGNNDRGLVGCELQFVPCVLVDPGVDGAFANADLGGDFFLCHALRQVELAGDLFFVLHK